MCLFQLMAIFYYVSIVIFWTNSKSLTVTCINNVKFCTQAYWSYQIMFRFVKIGGVFRTSNLNIISLPYYFPSILDDRNMKPWRVLEQVEPSKEYLPLFISLYVQYHSAIPRKLNGSRFRDSCFRDSYSTNRLSQSNIDFFHWTYP